MKNNIQINIKKKIYHILSGGNADIAFYTDAFLSSNKEWVMKKPIRFAIQLIKINIDCRLPFKKYIIKGLVPGKKCIARIHRRPKVYQYATAIMRYPCIITDVFGSLLELTAEFEEIYSKIEEEYQIPGFAVLRKKLDSPYKTIEDIYDEIGRRCNMSISKDIELDMLKRHIVMNPYLKKAFEIASYNGTLIIGILETSYSREDIQNILTSVCIQLSDIIVSSERKLSLRKMILEYRDSFWKMKNNVDSNSEVDDIAIVSANYNKALKHIRRYGLVPIYYRSPKEIMDSIPLPELTKEFSKLYQTIVGMELFSGQYNHKNIYELTYLYLAPIVFTLLQKTYIQARKNGGKVIALCDTECIFITLYERYYGNITPIPWSGLFGTNARTRIEWEKLLEDCYIIQNYPADRVAYSLGFGYRSQMIRNCSEDFIEQALVQARKKEKADIKQYVRSYLENDERLVIVDPMPGLYSINTFKESLHEIDEHIELEEIALSSYLKKSAKELNILHQVLQMDTPYISGIYGECGGQDNYLTREITFIQPKFLDEVKKETIYGALDDYCKAFRTYERRNNNVEISAKDMNQILEYSMAGLIQLEELLGGGAV
ncbi:hypothetical protein [Anaeromicropila herbilytica]|uniref:Uncharacterized protein n=1 Tax=Anaeromicropila herbilytica TaxID=2785025 RepID=A0A7R7EIY9_9FIRM|nr:hypothetical protein [Anaeromicropila herbilytica]BCN29604.1 hypothetical protein bsdtb5_08990 [Anaeromicropila herbilytica]